MVPGESPQEGHTPQVGVEIVEKSDEVIVPKKSAKTRVTPVESAEGRTEAEGKTRCTKRITSRKKRRAKLARIKEETEKRRHHRVADQHRWLSRVLEGHYRYYGVPTNYSAMAQFCRSVQLLWRRALHRRSQKAAWPIARWLAFDKVFPLPKPASIILGLPLASLSVDPRWEPGAGNPLAGFCPGGGPKGPSLPGQQAPAFLGRSAGGPAPPSERAQT